MPCSIAGLWFTSILSTKQSGEAQSFARGGLTKEQRQSQREERSLRTTPAEEFAASHAEAVKRLDGNELPTADGRNVKPLRRSTRVTAQHKSRRRKKWLGAPHSMVHLHYFRSMQTTLKADDRERVMNLRVPELLHCTSRRI